MANSGPIKIETRSVTELVPFARNSRTHADKQIGQIAASIKEFGWTNPLLVDGAGTIIAGHGRLLAARKLGLAEVPVIVLDHLTEAQRRALVIADNKIAANAGWDRELLLSELSALGDEGFDLSLIGFEPDEAEAVGATTKTHDGIQEVDSSKVADRFWISISGDLTDQADVLEAIKAVLRPLQGVAVELGTVNRDGLW